jgi:hypothetical protein
MSRAGRVSKGSAGTSATWWKGKSARSQPGASSSAPSVSQRKVAATRAYADRGRGAGDERERERTEPEKEKCGRQAVRAGLEHARERDVDLLRGSADPGERTGEARVWHSIGVAA